MSNSSESDYMKIPYILYLPKYWLEYGKLKQIPNYQENISQDQINLVLETMKERSEFDSYITGEDSSNNKNVINDPMLDKIFFNLYKRNENINSINEDEDKNILKIKYKNFFDFANLSWIGTENTILKNQTTSFIFPDAINPVPMTVSPFFYYPDYDTNDPLPCGNLTPCSIALKIQKELNYLLFDQDTSKFINFETNLTCSKQLEYMKANNLGKPIQETSSYKILIDKSTYDPDNKIVPFNPRRYVPKRKNNEQNIYFNPSIDNKNLYGISSSNLLTLQIVGSLANGVRDLNLNRNLTNDDIIFSKKIKEGAFRDSTIFLNGYNNPPTDLQFPANNKENVLNINANPILYNSVSDYTYEVGGPASTNIHKT